MAEIYLTSARRKDDIRAREMGFCEAKGGKSAGLAGLIRAFLPPFKPFISDWMLFLRRVEVIYSRRKIATSGMSQNRRFI